MNGISMNPGSSPAEKRLWSVTAPEPIENGAGALPATDGQGGLRAIFFPLRGNREPFDFTDSFTPGNSTTTSGELRPCRAAENRTWSSPILESAS
jgi:hypothetical protein